MDGMPSEVRAFVESHCLDCHDAIESEGGLNLEELSFDLEARSTRERWVQIFDRIQKKEMPPRESALSDVEREAFLTWLAPTLVAADRADIMANGRGPFRRLTRSEYENNLRELLALPDLDIRDRLPEERTSEGLSKAAVSLDMSRIQLAAYLDAAEMALREALAKSNKALEPLTYRAMGVDLYPKLGVHAGRESMHFSKNGRMVPISSADLRRIEETGEYDSDLEMALFRSATWPFYGYPRRFLAERGGAYRVRFAARAVRQLPGFRLAPALRPVPMTFRARRPSAADVSGDVRATGGILDIQPEQKIHATTIRLKAGETFEYSLLGLPVPHPITSHGGPLYYNFPPMPPDGHRGVAFQWLEVTGPLPPTEWPPESHRLLFGRLPIERAESSSSLPVSALSDDPEGDATRLMREFARRAARRPIADHVVRPFIQLIHQRLGESDNFTESVLAGYQAFLCSSEFLTLTEPHGDAATSHYAIASRLSHFLWESRPDDELLELAGQQALREPATLRRQVDRMIRDPRFERFVTGFTDEWLDLKDLRRDAPDIRLYPEYRKDDYLVDSMERETRAFFAKTLRDNLPVQVLIDSDFALVNDRLSRHYGLPPVSGSAIREVVLPESSPYGGLITQGALMKLTANGTTTSPVLRGVWVLENLLGDPPPPPPQSVPAVEPDLRGARSVRDILAAHTESPSCAKCHERFDPIGFALENFDIMGAWRDYYRGLENGDEITGIDRAGHQFSYRISQPVDASGALMTGESFHDIEGLKAILKSRSRQLAANLLRQWTLYATGSRIRFSERDALERLLDAGRADGYRVRDLLVGLIQSPIFLGIEATRQP